MKWFGEAWGAPVCDPDEQVLAPGGRPCARCAVTIEPDDQGVIVPSWTREGSIVGAVYHLDCFLDSLGVIVVRRDVVAKH